MSSKKENSGSVLIEGGIDIGSLLRASSRFQEARKSAKSDLEKAGTILLFRSTYELCWKTLQRLLKYRGLEPYSPKTVFREAALEKLIEKPDPWLEFTDAIEKVESAHDMRIASEVFARLNHFDREAELLIQRLQTLKQPAVHRNLSYPSN